MAAVKKKLIALSNAERLLGFTHMMVISANDLTETTVNTAQTFVVDLRTESVINAVGLRLQTPLQNTGDGAFNTNTVSVGDTGSATRWVNAAETNANGSFITAPSISSTSAGPYAASQQFIVTVNAMAAKALNSLNAGEIHVLVNLRYTKALDDAQLATAITK